MSETILPYSIDNVFRSVGVGSLDRALTDNLYGINHMQNPGMTKSNRDHQGFLFLTRPQLNLQKDNLRNYPELYPLLDDDPNSLAKAVRMTLDPRLGAGYRYKKGKGAYGYIPPITSNLMDNNMAFIPMITNNVVSVSGWPDEIMQTRESEPGLYKQVYALADGIPQNYGTNDISINVQNIAGDPVSLMLHTWLHYIGAIQTKRMYPYMDHIIGDRIDYQTRAYRVVLNERKTHVTKIFACAAGFPISNPTGMFADFNRETPFSEQTKEISFRLKTMGFIAYNPLLIEHFNRTVGMFNAAMTDQYREANMTLLPQDMMRVYNHKAYPRINPDTLAMEWWIPTDLTGDNSAELNTVSTTNSNSVIGSRTMV